MRTPKFKCHQCNKTDYTIKDWIKTNFVWEEFKYKYVEATCCKKQFSIDYLYLHEWKTLLHSR